MPRLPDWGRWNGAVDDGRAEHTHRHAFGGRRRSRLPDRIAGYATLLHADDPITPEHVFTSLKRLHHDLAGFPLPRLAPAILQIADPERLHCGSDWPFTPPDTVTQLAGELDAPPLFDDALRRRIFTANSLALFPRLAQQKAKA